MTTPRQTVLAWHAALNAGDLDRLLGLSTPDIAVGGPRGTGTGSRLLREWVERAGIQLEPVQEFAQGDTVVVEQRASWRGDDGTPGAPQPVASVFRVRDDRVSSVIRYPDLASALTATGITEPEP